MLRTRLRTRSGGGSQDPDAQAWAAAVVANSGTVSAATYAAVVAFTKAAKASGFWSKLNRINLFCGDQLAAALVPLKVGGGSATETNVNFVSGDYTEATGLTGNGTTKYLNTGLIPSVSLSANDTHLAYYNRGSANGGCVGGQTATDFFKMLAPYLGDQRIYSDQYNTTTGRVATAGAIGTPFGFLVGSRTAAGSHVVYRNGSSAASNATSGGSLPNVEVYVFAFNNNGVAAEFVNTPCAGYSIGSGLTAGDVTAYTTHMEAFQDALGRGVN